MCIQRALTAAPTRWDQLRGGTLNAVAAGNSEVILVHFWTVSQVWDTLAPAPILWRHVGSQANGGSREETHVFAGEGL